LLPAEAVNNAIEIEVADDITLHQVIAEGDVIAVWPPVAGG